MSAKNKQLNLLVVDDNKENFVKFERLIHTGDYFNGEVGYAGTGSEALKICANQAPDCVLLENDLPDMEGLEFLAKLAKSPPPPPRGGGGGATDSCAHAYPHGQRSLGCRGVALWRIGLLKQELANVWANYSCNRARHKYRRTQARARDDKRKARKIGVL